MENDSQKNKKRFIPFIDKQAEENLKGALIIFLIAYIVPVGICLIVNFFKEVIFGDYKLSEFDWKFYSFEQVNGFYQGIYNRVIALMNRLTH